LTPSKQILREGAETLFAVFAEHVDEHDPLSGLRVGARPTPETPHSVRSLRPGGTLVTTGVTSGDDLSDAELTRIFFLQLSVVGSTMGTRAELRALIDLLDVTGVRPVIDSILPMTAAPTGFRRMVDGQVFGKIVFTL
jgi:D-arabinose 1-dehydrogenase-like Zn-dependent alcohol dehydrogenase